MNILYIPNVIEEVPQMIGKPLLSSYESLVGLYGHPYGDKAISCINAQHVDGGENIPGYKDLSKICYIPHTETILHGISSEFLKRMLDLFSPPSDLELMAYKGTETMKQLAETLGLTYRYNHKNIGYYGNKSNLYDIFTGELLPKKFSDDEIRDLDPSMTIIIKDKNNASGLGVKKTTVSGIFQYLKARDLSIDEVIIQECVDIDKQYSLTFHTDTNGTALYQFGSEQNIRENTDGTFTYVQGTFNSVDSERIKNLAYPIFLNIADKKFCGIPVFGIDFVIDTDGSVKIMEINARTPGSYITANIIKHLGFMNDEYQYTQSGIYTRRPVQAFQSGLHEQKNTYEQGKYYRNKRELPFDQALFFTLYDND